MQALIDQELGPLIDQRRFQNRDEPRERVSAVSLLQGAEGGRSTVRDKQVADSSSLLQRKWPEEKVFIKIDPLRNFNVRAKVVGPGVRRRVAHQELLHAHTSTLSLQGLFVKYIQQETQTRVQIKGLGSGFVETDTGREGEDPMHIHVT